MNYLVRSDGGNGKRGKSLVVLYLIPFLLGVLIIVAIGELGSDIEMLSIIAFLLSIGGFTSTAKIYSYLEGRHNKKRDSTAKGDDEYPESPAIMLGAGGIYGIIMGLGIFEALTTYEGVWGSAIVDYLKTHALDLGILGIGPS